MGQYLIRRLLIAVPSLLGISFVLFCVLALAPGDPFGELTTNPNVPPEVAAALRDSGQPVYVKALATFYSVLPQPVDAAVGFLHRSKELRRV